MNHEFSSVRSAIVVAPGVSGGKGTKRISKLRQERHIFSRQDLSLGRATLKKTAIKEMSGEQRKLL